MKLDRLSHQFLLLLDWKSIDNISLNTILDLDDKQIDLSCNVDLLRQKLID